MVRGNPLVRNKSCLAHAVTEDAQLAPRLQSMGRTGNSCKSNKTMRWVVTWRPEAAVLDIEGVDKTKIPARCSEGHPLGP